MVKYNHAANQLDSQSEDAMLALTKVGFKNLPNAPHASFFVQGDLAIYSNGGTIVETHVIEPKVLRHRFLRTQACASSFIPESRLASNKISR